MSKTEKDFNDPQGPDFFLVLHQISQSLESFLEVAGEIADALREANEIGERKIKLLEDDLYESEDSFLITPEEEGEITSEHFQD